MNKSEDDTGKFSFFRSVRTGEECLEIVDSNGQAVSVVPRSAAHGNPALMHKVVHVLVFNSCGDLLLQKRSLEKEVAPGQWDTSVGGHVLLKEKLEAAARREMKEELGIAVEKMDFLYSYIYRNAFETELVHSYNCVSDGPFSFNRGEIDEIQFWPLKQISDLIHLDIFSDYFRAEFVRYSRINLFEK